MSMEELILVVDDNRQNLVMLESFLQEEGYSVKAVSSGEEALAVLRENAKIKLVLLDVMMPGINGIEVCEKIKFEMGRDELPIILVTSLDAREDRLEGLEAGADDFITKPIDWAELMARVKSLLRFKRAHDRVENQRQRLEHQLNLAKRVQKALADLELPPEQPGEIFYRPMEKIGGDVYDLISLSDEKYGILLADAMGHGVPAAMVMVMVKLIFKNLDCNKLTPAEVMSRMNSRLAEIFRNEIGEMFVTGVYMEYDKAGEELVCCNAGHPPPLLFNGRGEVKKLTASSTPLGITGDNNFRVEAIDAAEFKEIFIYTDGLVDHICSKSLDLSQEHIDHIYKKIGERAENGGFTAFYRELKNEIDLNKGNDDITYMLLKID